jgi:adenosylcobinamide-GDP ribazoletransferase
VRQLKIALQFLTRLPVEIEPPPAPTELARAAPLFPLVGVLVGLAGGGAYALAWRLGLSGFLGALIAVVVMVLLTGALHEDGLADVADGLGGGRTRARKLEIMRDSRLGSYGALALMLVLLGRTGALASLGVPEVVVPALIGAAVVSRAAILPPMLLPPARTDGRASEAGQPSPVGVGIGLALALAIGLALLDPVPALAATVLALVAAGGVGLLAWRQLGGITGDVLGASQQAAEITFLFALTSRIG